MEREVSISKVSNEYVAGQTRYISHVSRQLPDSPKNICSIIRGEIELSGKRGEGRSVRAELSTQHREMILVTVREINSIVEMKVKVSSEVQCDRLSKYSQLVTRYWLRIMGEDVDGKKQRPRQCTVPDYTSHALWRPGQQSSSRSVGLPNLGHFCYIGCVDHSVCISDEQAYLKSLFRSSKRRTISRG